MGMGMRKILSSDEIYEDLSEKIVELKYMPGEKISENDLSAQYGVSRHVVRSAITRLKERKLVDVYPQRGTFVSLMDMKYIETVLYVREAVRCGADFIVSGAGLPFSLPELTKGSTVKILPIVSSARACRLIVGKWLRQGRLPDAVVVEGPLAGGHLGFKYQDMVQNTYPALEDCVAEVRAYLDTVESEHHVSIPVIAGGGLAAHEDVCRMLSLGAAGVQLGTRFVATEECDACPAFKQAYLNACEEDIRIIKSPVGLAARAISNPFLQMAEEQGRIPPARCYRCMEACSPAETKYCISGALFDAANDGSGLIFCGAGAAKLHELTTVPLLLAELSG